MIQPPDDLPKPDSAALAHSERLVDIVRESIAEDGPIPFSHYMQAVLYHPGLGYYAAGAQKFGAAGDFVTAPELSPLFIACMAEQAADVLRVVGGEVLELGAGTGTLAAGLLNALAEQNQLPSRYCIVEASAELQRRQRDTIAALAPHALDRVVWLQALPENFTGFVLGNEVMDAFPVERFRIMQSGPVAIGTDWQDGRFRDTEMASSADLSDAIAALQGDLAMPMPEGYISDACLYLAPWIRSLSAMLTRGAIVLLDYGYPRQEYYAPERHGGTLRCHYRHRVHADPYLWPGLQDIGAHVDFTALVEAGVNAGLTLEGFTTQAQFLLATQLLQHAERVSAQSPAERVQVSQQVQQLTLPGAMGERFLAVGFSRGMDAVLLGFTGADHSHRL